MKEYQFYGLLVAIAWIGALGARTNYGSVLCMLIAVGCYIVFRSYAKKDE